LTKTKENQYDRCEDEESQAAEIVQGYFLKVY
jgi:hypothetical protein